jgi:hypothetical protein
MAIQSLFLMDSKSSQQWEPQTEGISQSYVCVVLPLSGQ